MDDQEPRDGIYELPPIRFGFRLRRRNAIGSREGVELECGFCFSAGFYGGCHALVFLVLSAVVVGLPQYPPTPQLL
jgi:hypothetical protein